MAVYLRFRNQVKGIISLDFALALDSDTGLTQILMGSELAKTTEVGLFTVYYIGLTQEEYEANAESPDEEVQSRILDAMKPFISLLVIKDGLTSEDVERIVGSPVDMNTLEVQAKVEGFTFSKTPKRRIMNLTRRSPRNTLS